MSFDVRGTKRVLRAAEWSERGQAQCDFTTFWEALSRTLQNALLTRFRRYADLGHLPAPAQFRMVGDNLFEFKLTDGPRVMAYNAGQRERGLVVLTHGFIKKSPRTPPQQIERARTIRRYMGDG